MVRNQGTKVRTHRYHHKEGVGGVTSVKSIHHEMTGGRLKVRLRVTSAINFVTSLPRGWLYWHLHIRKLDQRLT